MVAAQRFTERGGRAGAFGLVVALLSGAGAWATDEMILNEAVVVVRPGQLPNAEKAAAVVLVEEVERRTGIRLATSTTWPAGKTVIAISSGGEVSAWDRSLPGPKGSDRPGSLPEGYRLVVDTQSSSLPVVWIHGADPRGALYGVGALLRNLNWRKGHVSVPGPLDVATAPVSSIRGHQLGYRARANSWDAWDADQFDQYIRELALFGLNSIENIPFEDERKNPLMKLSRRDMNRELSEICDRYDLDYWVWTPADYDLSDAAIRAKMLDKHEEFYRDCKRLSAVFFPGGDPGHNPPELVLPYLEDIAKRLLPIHPDARVWLSLQWFNAEQVDFIYAYLERERPDWLGGLVAGPSSPSLAETRRRLPVQYKLRMYPDITHNKLSQYVVPWWDQAYALTLGREAINPRPVQYAHIHNWYAPNADGFITYSDGVHDDVNKTIWSARGWDRDADVRDVLAEYCRLFFGPDVAEDAADGILALEKNWHGPLATNASVNTALLYWQRLEEKAPQLNDNWRWQMNLARAYYDAYIRCRLLNESGLERQANAILSDAPSRGADTSMKEALSVLNRAVAEPCRPDLRARIGALCEDLFNSIGLQTSVETYHASGAERGAFLDFVDYPMNNRWWLEDEFARISALSTEAEKLERLEVIRTWEDPGPGSYYDDLGNVAKCPHVKRRTDANTDPSMRTIPGPTFWWWDNGMSRARLSWQVTMDWPEAMVYEGLDPEAGYTVRLTGYGKSLLRMNDVRVTPVIDGKEIGEFKEFVVLPELIGDGTLILTWDRPTDEGHLNWRKQSRVAEVWLLKE